jgi:hypothetical protein
VFINRRRRKDSMRYQQALFETMAAGKTVSDSLIDQASRELTSDAVEHGHDPCSPGVSRWRRDLRAAAAEHNRGLIERREGTA